MTFNHSTPASTLAVTQRFGPYRTPTELARLKFKALQEKCQELALLIDEACPPSQEKATALTDLVKVKMGANAAIALYELEPASPPSSQL